MIAGDQLTHFLLTRTDKQDGYSFLLKPSERDERILQAHGPGVNMLGFTPGMSMWSHDEHHLTVGNV